MAAPTFNTLTIINAGTKPTFSTSAVFGSDVRTRGKAVNEIMVPVLPLVTLTWSQILAKIYSNCIIIKANNGMR